VANVGGGSSEFLGHPKGLTYLTLTELWERFSYYGMMGLLTLYMTKQLLLPGHVEHVLGFSGFRAAIEGVFGPLTTLALASQIFGLYTGFVYLTPIIGGFIGDRWLGQRVTVVMGTLLMATGHLLMTSEPFFLVALASLVIGAGFIKGNMAAQVGRLYATEDTRRTRAFGIYLIGLNVGAFTAPLICGTLGEKVGFHWGFGAAGIGMLISLATYLIGQRHLPPDSIRRAGGTVAAPRLKAGDGRRIVALLALMIPYILVFSAYQQSWNIFTIWADTHVNRKILGFEAPVTWFATLDGILTILAVFVAIRLWAWQAKRSREGHDSRKISEGLVMGTVGFLILAGGTFLAGPAKVALFFPVIYFVLQDLMIPFVDTVIMSTYSKNAPAAVNTTMIGVYYLGSAISNIAVGWLGRFYETMGPGQFWLLHAAVAAAGLVFMLLLGGVLNRMMAPAASPTPGDEIEATTLTVEASP
jgi:POT family proton-dependent oligopeptide transporter